MNGPSALAARRPALQSPAPVNGLGERDPNKQPEYWRRKAGDTFRHLFSPQLTHFLISECKAYSLTLHSLYFGSPPACLVNSYPALHIFHQETGGSAGSPSTFVFEVQYVLCSFWERGGWACSSAMLMTEGVCAVDHCWAVGTECKSDCQEVTNCDVSVELGAVPAGELSEASTAAAFQL